MYIPLTKIYYSNPNDYEKIYSNKFNSESSEHLKFSNCDSELFFLYTKNITNLLHDIQKHNGDVIKLCEKLPVVALTSFGRKCLIDEILQTNEIEGVHSTRKEISSIIENPSSQKRFHGIVNKYLKLSEETEIEKAEDVRKIYDELVYGEIKSDDENSILDGVIFRKDTVGVFTATGKKIHTGLYPETKIIEAMTEAITILHSKEINSLIAISIFHYLFGYIHPFYDGNGRTSRFISSYYFAKELNPLIGYRLSYTIKENIKAYYESFEVTNNKLNRGDLTYFIEMFLDVLNKSMTNLIAALRGRLEKLNFYKEILVSEIGKRFGGNNKLIDDELNLMYVLTQATLFSEDGITLNKLTEVMEKSTGKIRQLITNEKIKDLIIVNTQKRKHCYSANCNKLDEINLNKN